MSETEVCMSLTLSLTPATFGGECDLLIVAKRGEVVRSGFIRFGSFDTLARFGARELGSDRDL